MPSLHAVDAARSMWCACAALLCAALSVSATLLIAHGHLLIAINCYSFMRNHTLRRGWEPTLMLITLESKRFWRTWVREEWVTLLLKA